LSLQLGKARLQRLLKSRFVSGHDFSRAESTLFAKGFSPGFLFAAHKPDFFIILFSLASEKPPRSGHRSALSGVEGQNRSPKGRND
jgi:hypothetical protein